MSNAKSKSSKTKNYDFDFEDVGYMLRDHWKKAWERHTRLPVCKKRIEELHPSSFPFCTMKYALNLAGSGDEEHFDMSATMEYYCGVGTVAHLIFQKHNRLLAGDGNSKPVMVGDWTCPSCNHFNEFRPYHKCKKCKSPAIQGEVGRLSGDEISVQLGTRTTGHTDDVIKVGNKYYVVDYKTSSVAMINMYKKFGRALPYKHNVKQIESYVALLERKYNIEISGWFLIYVARDKPNTEVAFIGAEITEEKRDELHEMIVNADKGFNSARKYIATALSNNEPMFNGDTKKISKYVDALYKNRLCSCEQVYKDEYHDKYDPCPYAENGLCFNEKSMKYLAKNVFLRVGSNEQD